MEWDLNKAAMVLIFAAMFVGTAGAANFVPALQMDTYTDANEKNQSFGSEDTLWVSSQGGKPVQIAYLTFEGMTTLPQQISSSSLKLYIKEVKHPGEVSIYLYDQAVMDIITWSDRPEYNPEALGILDIEENGSQTFDTTNFVKKAAIKCSEGCPFSVVLVADDDTSVALVSMEGSAEEKPVLQYETS